MDIHSHCTSKNVKVNGRIVFRPHSLRGCPADMYYKAFENKIMLTIRLATTGSRSHGRREKSVENNFYKPSKTWLTSFYYYLFHVYIYIYIEIDIGRIGQRTEEKLKIVYDVHVRVYTVVYTIGWSAVM